MTTGHNPGSPAVYVNLAGTSNDNHAHGGRDLPQPRPVATRVQVRATNSPATDRWIVLRTKQLTPSPLFEVGVLDGHNHPTQPPRDYPTYSKARRAANRLYAQLTTTEEN